MYFGKKRSSFDLRQLFDDLFSTQKISTYEYISLCLREEAHRNVCTYYVHSNFKETNAIERKSADSVLSFHCFSVTTPTYVKMLQPKKIQLLCLRNLASETSTVLIENDASKIKPFEAIPTAPGGQTPILGHIPTLFRTKYGFGKSWMNFKDLKAKYAKNDNIMRFRVPLYNRRNGNLVVLFESNEIETIYRAEGKYPFR